MKKVAAEPYRDVDFSEARRGPVIPAEPGKTKIFIRIDNAGNKGYIGSVIVADANNRYYEPAPKRNGTIGLNAEFSF